MLAVLKEQVHCLNIVLVLIALSYVFRKSRPKWSRIFRWSAGLFFALISTSYAPFFLAQHLEQQHPPLTDSRFRALPGPVFVHVLGSGYNHDTTLPAVGRLGTVALARLSEGLRLFRLRPDVILVGSGPAADDDSLSQADVLVQAAVSLGVPKAQTLALKETPTTREEARALYKASHNLGTVVVVTDALHMPRAMDFFREEGFKPVAAPTNYAAAGSFNDIHLGLLPRVENLQLSNRVFHEYVARITNRFVP